MPKFDFWDYQKVQYWERETLNNKKRQIEKFNKPSNDVLNFKIYPYFILSIKQWNHKIFLI